MRRSPRTARRRADVRGSISGIALITLIALKLTGVITWSWWWVLSPIWISGILLVLALCTLVVLLYREARRQMRMFMDQFRSADWRRGAFVAGEPHSHASGGNASVTGPAELDGY
jgi:Flp pilus assembly protein TadB